MKFNSPKTVLIVSLTTITTFTHANQSSELEQLRAEVNELRQMLQAQQAIPANSIQVPHVPTASVITSPEKKYSSYIQMANKNPVPMLICMALFVLILPISLKVRKVCLTALMVCY